MEGCTRTLLMKPFLTNAFTVILIISIAQPISATSTPLVYTNFIRRSCNSTTYPPLCIETLSPYAYKVQTNFLKLCNAALEVTIQAAQNATTLVTTLARQGGLSSNEAAAVKDCVGESKDCVDELKRTLGAMGQLGGSDKAFQWANAKTWASAAITDTDTCMTGLSEEKVSAVVKNKISSSILNVGKLTSNALSLINLMPVD